MLKRFKHPKFMVGLTILLTVAIQSSAFAAWDISSADNKVRQFLGTVLFVLSALLAIKAYAKGRKGVAISEILVGAFIGIFVATSDPSKSLMDYIKGVLGF